MGVNRVMLLGRLGQEPELRYTASQTPICNLSLATTEKRKGADGEWAEQTEWHRIVVFGKQAENCNQYLSKGREAFVEGRIQTRQWQDKEGNNRYTTEIIAHSVQFIGGRGDAPQMEKTFSSAPTKSQAPTASTGNSQPVSFDDDDIPF